MTSADLYRRLTIPARATVLGWRLVPFTVGHAVLFDRLGVDEIQEWQDIVVAAKLCSMPADKAERWASSPWRRRMTWALVRWTKLHLVIRPQEVAKAIKVFGQYLEEWTKAPRHESCHKADSKPCGSPPAQALRVVLMSRLGYSSAEVDRLPYARAVWDYLSYMESEGHVRIAEDLDDETEAEMQRRADEFARKVTAEWGSN